MSTYHLRSLAPKVKNSSLIHFPIVIRGCSNVCFWRLNGNLSLTVINHSLYNKLCLFSCYSFSPVLHSFSPFFPLTTSSHKEKTMDKHIVFQWRLQKAGLRKVRWKYEQGLQKTASFSEQWMWNLRKSHILQGFAQEAPYFTEQHEVANSTWNWDNTYLPIFFFLQFPRTLFLRVSTKQKN